ncbi:MAG: hypothetical protein ACQESF_06355 [Nanobdellota archaeon]
MGSKSSDFNYANSGKIIPFDFAQLYDLTCTCYKKAYDKRKVNQEFYNNDFNHLTKVLTNNFTGYTEKLAKYMPLLEKPVKQNTYFNQLLGKHGFNEWQKQTLMIDSLVNLGDSCAYAKGFDNAKFWKSMDIGKAGRIAYEKTSQLYKIALEDEKLLQELSNAGIDPDDEMLYYNKLAERFNDYVTIIHEIAKEMYKPRLINRQPAESYLKKDNELKGDEHLPLNQ